MGADRAGDRLAVYCLDVGQGDCTFIVPPEGEGDPVLVDCADAYVAERFVANHGIRRLAAVVATHLDSDHVRGLLPFLRGFFEGGGQVRRLVIGLDREPADVVKRVAAGDLVGWALAWDRAPPHEGFSVAPPFREEEPRLLARGPGWSVELVLPHYGRTVERSLGRHGGPNAVSAVVRVKRGETALLVGGDADLGSWERLEPELLDAEVIRVPHHGGDIRSGARSWSGPADLYDAVRPRVGVVSVGTRNRWNHPDVAHVAAVRRQGACRVLCTQLTARCHPEPFDLRERNLRHVVGVEWPYRHRADPAGGPRSATREVPCAGSVVIWMDGAGRVGVEPAVGGWHDGEVLDYVEHPLCRGEEAPATG